MILGKRLNYAPEGANSKHSTVINDYYRGNSGYRRRYNAYETMGLERGTVNYEYERQNNRHVKENCGGLIMNYTHET